MMLSYQSAIKLKRINKIPLVNKMFNVASQTRLSKGETYWREELWTKQIHRMDIKFFGRAVLSLPYKIEVGDVYLQRKRELFFRHLGELIDEGRISKIDSTSLVFEPGCNAGGVLRRLYRETDCSFWGMDISTEAIEFARNKVFPNNPKATFTTGNVLETSFFKQFKDNHFTHAFCVSHLVHISNCPEKTTYINELKRIARNVVLFERINPKDFDHAGKQNFEDYEKKYGFTLFRQMEKGKGGKYVGMYYFAS